MDFTHVIVLNTRLPLVISSVRVKNLDCRSAIPMVCFCDLPIGLIRRHMLTYGGGYGIGLDKSWGLKHGVEPVFYTHSKGNTRKPMARLTASNTRLSIY
jgi:hypothetical protein